MKIDINVNFIINTDVFMIKFIANADVHNTIIDVAIHNLMLMKC